MSIIEQYTHPLVNALGWSLLHSLWQIALIGLLLKLALMFTSSSRAGVRYNISLLALLAVPLGFVMSFMRQWGVYRDAVPIVSFEFGEASLPAIALESQLVVIRKSSSAWMHTLESYTPVICWIYLTGLLLFVLYSLFSYLRLRALRRKSRISLPDIWQNKLKLLYRKSGVRHLIPVYLSEKVHIPAVVGFLKPVVLLPISMLSSLSPEQIETILLHELYHIRRYDHYINLFQHLTETIFFYHPMTWWIGRQLRLERENRVDEWIVRETGRPLEYARALIQIESSRKGVLPLAVAATQSKSHLFTRIKNIMTMKTRSLHSGQVAAIMLILTATISIAWLNPAVVVSHSGSDPGYRTHSDMPYPQAFSMMPEEEAPDTPPPFEQAQERKPKTVRLADGKAIEWDSLSHEDKEQVRKALEEAHLAVVAARKEVLEAFNSDEFKAQMALAREEVKKAMQEVDRELAASFQSEAFQREMQQVKEEVQRAMAEANREMTEKFQSEEFQLEMQKIGEEVRKAVEEARREVQLHLQSDEFKQQMEHMREELNKAMEEMDRSLKEVGPAVQESLKEINMEEILKEIQRSLEQINEEEQQSE
jgi:bla regulator protein blaR1